MGIKGLTDRVTNRQAQQGKSVRLGFLGKGRREGFGRNVKLFDEKYFVFKGKNEELEALFRHVYGEKPTVIPDVRIPVDMAGNFNVEDCAWLTASKHTDKGSTFMARSDGESIIQMRDPETGRVNHYDRGVVSYDDVTRLDQFDRECFIYGDKLYTWSRSFVVDLLLPDFNEVVFEHDVAGYGVVTFTTHSVYDIGNLIGEYNAIINELVALLSNPLAGDADRVRRYLPLRNFPLRLYRSEDTIGTPNWRKDSKAGDRLVSTRSLVHWQLASNVSAAIQAAIDQRTKLTIAAIARAPMLTSSDSVAQANADLFGDSQPAAPVPLPEVSAIPATDWDELFEREAPVEPENGDEPAEEVVEEPAEEPEEEIVEGVFEDEETPPDDIMPTNEDGLTSAQADGWSSIEEKMEDKGGGPIVTLGVIADALSSVNPVFSGRRDVWNWLNSKDCKDIRDVGVKIYHSTYVTKKGARTIYERGLAHE